jgi:D-alanyl-lipoteichoic acid acyltransferase DltB (MBOAT superfamily)
MSFHSVDYLLFLPLIVVMYFLTPAPRRWIVLLIASNIFYLSWRIEFLPLLWFTTLADYGVARLLGRTARTAWRRLLLGISLTANLGLLLFFKYGGPVFNGVTGWLEPGQVEPVSILLPLGISFYTFQTLGYTIDVYRKRREPERHLGYFAVYVMYFPQLLAGPIERPGKLLPQLRRERRFDLRLVAAGGFLMLVGYFKKLVIADRLAQIVPLILAEPQAYSPALVLLGALGNIYRYYADLSGYADIAIGSALMMGIRLTQNFNRPFAAVSISAFWQRWHITVTTWFRDYLYLPIARTASGPWRKPLATILTIVIISGWHGASWVWLLTGLVAGVIMVLEGAVRRMAIVRHTYHYLATRTVLGAGGAKTLGTTVNRIVLWGFLLLLGSLVNAPDWRDGLAMWVAIAQVPGELAHGRMSLTGIHTFHASAAILPFAIAALEIFQYADSREPVFERMQRWSKLSSWALVYGILASIIVLGTYASADFIYFRF